LALVGLILGFLGLGIAAYRTSVESEMLSPPEISDVVSDTIKKTADKLMGKKDTPDSASEWLTSRNMGLAASACGFLGVVLGCLSWLKGERGRWIWASLAVGVVALAWTHVVVAVSVAVGVAVFLMVLGA
jgi:VIT1/CCC1 family predicted Fe2+/Mn2+ transporter